MVVSYAHPNQFIDIIYQHTRSLFAGEAHLERGTMMNKMIYLPLTVNMFVHQWLI